MDEATQHITDHMYSNRAGLLCTPHGDVIVPCDRGYFPLHNDEDVRTVDVHTSSFLSGTRESWVSLTSEQVRAKTKWRSPNGIR